MSVPLIRWDAPGPYHVAFSTRQGGVSDAPYDSLNLGRSTRDDPKNVDENRQRLCETVGVDPEQLALQRQVHGAVVNRAEAGARSAEGDGLWADEAGVPMLAFSADCLPIALARRNRSAGLALLHAGRLGLLAGIVEAGVAVLGDQSRRSSARESGRAATRSATTSPALTGPASVPTSCADGTSISGPLRRRFSAAPASTRSSGSTCALRVLPIGSSRTGATAPSPAGRE